MVADTTVWYSEVVIYVYRDVCFYNMVADTNVRYSEVVRFALLHGGGLLLYGIPKL
jgi:hypothetical protein